jgi:hypothetical protein
MITTTLNRILEHYQRSNEWANLLAGLGKTAPDDEPLPFTTILAINGLDDALWCCRAEPQYAKEWRLLMVAYARRVEHLNTNPNVKNAIDVAERHANGEATNGELHAARANVWAVRAAARAARDAAMAAGNAARAAAGDEVWFAARAARDAAAGAAARDDSARPTKDAIRAAWEAERKWQEQEFLRCVTETGASDGYR